MFQPHRANGPSQHAPPPLPPGEPQPPPLPSEPPLPEEPPPLPQDPAVSWHQQPTHASSQAASVAGAVAAPPWATQQPPWDVPAASPQPGYAHSHAQGAYSHHHHQQPQMPADPYAQMYGQAWAGQGQQQAGHHHLQQQHHPAYRAPAYPAPGYANMYPAGPYQVGQYGAAYPPGAPQLQHGAHDYQQPGAAWDAAQQYQYPPQQQQQPHQQPIWATSAAGNPHIHSHGAPPLPASAAPLPAAQAAPLPSPERRPPAPANVTPVQALLDTPGRASRPRRIAVVLRGLPGSGKSHAARRLRDAELAAGAPAPRIHSIDDYFVTEVEKEVWESDAGGKRRRRTVQETEYCYEADMEGVYKGSLLKAFRRTVEEGRFGFVIVDADNARVEDFKPYWDAGQRAGYEVYILEMPDSSVESCLARNIHGRTKEEIEAAFARWEPVPPSMPQLDAGAWLRGATKSQVSIQEFDMEDDSSAHAAAAEADGDESAAAQKASRWASLDDGERKAAKRAKRGQSASAADRDPTQRPRLEQEAPSALRGPGRRKTVRWADEAEGEEAGFSIGGAALRQLETVYVLEGLGPPKEAPGPDDVRSFADQVKEDHKSEQRNFRDILLGHARPF